MKNLIIAAAALAVAAPVAPVAADPPPWAPAHGWREKQAQRYHDRHRGRYYQDRRYYAPRRLGYRDRVWRGEDGRYRCRRPDGTTGLIIGGAAGALIGRELDGGRSRTLGTIIGAGAGALLGREIERGNVRCR